jgi:hypothetical protein
MLERLHCQLHEPGDQKGKGIGKKKKQCSAGVSPAERDYIRNESGKVFDGWILNGCSGRGRDTAPAAGNDEPILPAITLYCQVESARYYNETSERA